MDVRQVNITGYIRYVNSDCEGTGEWHAVVGKDGARPVVLCGADVSKLNWTLYPAERVEGRERSRDVCRTCRHLTEKARGQ